MATIIDSDNPQTPVRFEISAKETDVSVYVRQAGFFRGGFLAKFENVASLDALIDALVDARANAFPNKRARQSELQDFRARLVVLESYVFGEGKDESANGA